ncbi:hypothetical protein KZ782_32590 [Mycolicibacterium smegmatis]|nr:hypothetical protein KZ782_32590 [Mycolicibacterium smegmatis]
MSIVGQNRRRWPRLASKHTRPALAQRRNHRHLTAAAATRTVLATQVAPALTAITPDRPAERAGLLGAFVIGLATTRYVLANPAVAQLSRENLIRWTAPVIRQLLTGPVGEVADVAHDRSPTA